MEVRTRFSRLFDLLVFSLLLYAALAVFFTAQLRNLLWGALTALPVSLLLLYAASLWNRRVSGARAAKENGAYHLKRLMLMPAPEALRVAAGVVARAHSMRLTGERDGMIIGELDGREAAFLLLQRPPGGRIGADTVLELYQNRKAERLIAAATAPFTQEAAVFARQLRQPEIALLGADALEPLLRSLPRDEASDANDKKRRRRATAAELRARACDPERTRRYLLYGTLMLTGYIALDVWPFLIPGLICVFLAVISRRQKAKGRGLFDE